MAQLKITIQKDTRPNRNKPWLVRWYGEYDPRTDKQKRHSKSFKKRVQAEQFAKQLEEDFDNGLPRDVKNITLSQLLDEFLHIHKKEYTAGTTENYEHTMKRLLDYFSPTSPLNRIDKKAARKFISDLEYLHPYKKNNGKELSDSGRSIQLRACKTIFTTAVNWNYIRFNPFEDISVKIDDEQPWHFITPDQFNTILLKSRTIMEKAFYAVQYGCGLRSGEALNLLWDGINIDFETNRITIVNRPGTIDMPGFTIKDKEARSVAMPDWVVDLLVKLQGESSENCPFVFLTHKRWMKVQEIWHRFRAEGRTRKWKNRDLKNNVLRDFQQCCSRAGIKTHERLILHCLRKSWATNLAQRGVPIKTLMKMGGWSRIETVEKFYLKCTDENEKQAVEILNGMVKVG